MRYMLDTNTCIFVIKNKPESVREKFISNDGKLCISSITYGELLHGAYKSANPNKHLNLVADFVSRLDIIDYNATAAEHYGDIRAQLQNAGLDIGENDSHIAAHARSCGLKVVTHNVKHFDRVEGLLLENWVKG